MAYDVLLAPEAAGADHLKALARVSRLLRDSATCEKLRGAKTADGGRIERIDSGGTADPVGAEETRRSTIGHS